MMRVFIFILAVVVSSTSYPWIAFVLLCVSALFNKHNLFEIIIIGVLIDVIHQSIISFGIISIPLYTISSVLLYIVIPFLSKRIISHVQ